VVEDIYSGEGTDFIRCLECGYKSERITKFYDLQLPVKNEFENVSAVLNIYVCTRSAMIQLKKLFLVTFVQRH
jgi:hypothetical protein